MQLEEVLSSEFRLPTDSDWLLSARIGPPIAHTMSYWNFNATQDE
jgi:hypothetical protein